MIYDKNTEAGCAMVRWTEDSGDKKCTRITCNYGQANLAGRPTYVKGGDMCSDCSTCDDLDFPGLCAE